MIYVNNLEKSFGKNNVLKGVNEHIKKGEVVVVIGPSGSGKSTFLRCLNLLEEPTGGEIIFEGKNITDKKVNINKLREKMGLVFQQFNLFPHKTVLENITIATSNQIKTMPEEMEKLCVRKIEKLDNTLIEEFTDALSCLAGQLVTISEGFSGDYYRLLEELKEAFAQNDAVSTIDNEVISEGDK